MKNTTFIKPTKLRDDAIIRVLIKLNELKGHASFDDTRWIFDWDDHRHQLENIDICNYELDALTTLQNNKVISFRYEATPDIQVFNHNGSGKLEIIRDYREQKDYRISSNQYFSPDGDKAGLQFHTAVWITSFDIDRFNSYSDSLNVTFTKDKVMVSLEMDSTSPVVIIGNKQYRMPSLHEGMLPALLIEAIWDRLTQLNRNQITISSSELPVKFKNKNLSQVLKDSSFGSGGILADFITARSHSSITFSKIAALSLAKTQEITTKRPII